MSADRERYLEKAKQDREMRKVKVQKTLPQAGRRDLSLLESARTSRLPAIQGDYHMRDRTRQSMPATTKHSRTGDMAAHLKR